MHQKYKEFLRIWQESGAWRRFSFEEFVRIAVDIVNKKGATRAPRIDTNTSKADFECGATGQAPLGL